MKRYIRSNTTDLTIFEDEYFDFVKTHGIGIQDTPWTGLEVKSKGLAKKHVVEIRLNVSRRPHFNGDPEEYRYSDCYISHGMRSVADTLDETAEYIEVLEDALDFAERVNEWLYRNNQ